MNVDIGWELKGSDFAAKFMQGESRDVGLLGFSSSPHEGMISTFI